MILNRALTLSLVAALCATTTTRAAADADGLVGGIIGGIIGGAIVNETNRNRQTRTTRVQPRTTMSAATRAANREVQTALNYFNFPVGSADGVLGQRSRTAIGEYQALLGYPATGQLTDYERNFLVSGYQRAIYGGGLTTQLIAANPMGPRGLLLGYRDEMMGLTAAVPPVTAPALVAVVPAPAAPTVTIEDAEPAAPPALAGQLPNFLGDANTQTSLASECNKVSLLTNSNGGFTTLATMRDPEFALGEQFCLARTYAITQGEELAARINGVAPAEIARQCEAFAPAMRDHIAALSLQPAAQVLQGVGSFALNAGMAPAQLSATARICLSVGYRTDNMDVAIGSALLLTVLGEKPYAELLGHHLAQGFGASRRPDLAMEWFDIAFTALAQNGAAVFVPGEPGRTELLRVAAGAVGGRLPTPAVENAPIPAAALPAFDLGGATATQTD